MKATNLDCMPVSALEAFIAESLASGTPSDHIVLEYSRAKITAIKYRLSGDISAAINVECRCDEYYARMPKKYRW